MPEVMNSGLCGVDVPKFEASDQSLVQFAMYELGLALARNKDLVETLATSVATATRGSRVICRDMPNRQPETDTANSAIVEELRHLQHRAEVINADITEIVSRLEL